MRIRSVCIAIAVGMALMESGSRPAQARHGRRNWVAQPAQENPVQTQPAATSPKHVQLAFIFPPGMWLQTDAYEHGKFDSDPLIVPARQNFRPATSHRLKLSKIPGR